MRQTCSLLSLTAACASRRNRAIVSFVDGDVVAQQLDRHLLVEPHVTRLDDQTHATAPEGLFHAVLAEQ